MEAEIDRWTHGQALLARVVGVEDVEEAEAARELEVVVQGLVLAAHQEEDGDGRA